MKLILLCLCVAAANAALAPIYMAQRRGIPNSFIIKAKDASVLDQIETDILAEFQTMRMPAPKVSKIRDLIPVLNLRIPPHMINTIRAIDGIEFVEQEAMAQILGQQYNPTWGIDRIDSRDGIDGVYNFNDGALGENGHVYIVDTGMRTTHSEFHGRAQLIFGGPDDNGHGTHCGGTVAGATYGIARKASIYSAKVCTNSGGCPTYLILDGLNAVSQRPKGVVSMSLGGGANHALDAGVQALIDTGYVLSIAAGNSDSDACYNSPARVPDAITVAASDNQDKIAYFSCWGSCVDIFAPGVNIESASHNWDTGSATMSGTSMACPHVSGVATLYFVKNGGATGVVSQLLGDASNGKIYYTKGSPNKLLYSGNL
ncbi:aqualysin-1-like [Asterias amurensis]|uniref:aqualysin-1-like n=1 Tax=Asterias amurensis TaxID=7602 RepID=UPI003AB7F7CF